MIWTKLSRRARARPTATAAAPSLPPATHDACADPRGADGELRSMLAGLAATIGRLQRSAPDEGLDDLRRDLTQFETSPHCQAFRLDFVWKLHLLRLGQNVPSALIDRLRAEQDLLEHKRRDLDQLLLALDGTCGWRLTHALEGAERYVCFWIAHLALHEELQRRGALRMAEASDCG